MHFDEDFVKSLPDDWPHTTLLISDKLNFIREHDPDALHAAVEEAWALLSVLSPKWDEQFTVPEIYGDRDSDIAVMLEFFTEINEEAERVIKEQAREAKLSHYQNVYEISLGNVFHFEFSEGDLERIQQLTNELRDLISKSEEFEEKHKQRLLRKLEKFQSELHKKVSDLDRAWGFLLEASIYIGQMGGNVKPMVDRIRELVSIIGPTSTRAYDLPSNLPIKLLGQSENDKSEDGKS